METSTELTAQQELGINTNGQKLPSVNQQSTSVTLANDTAGKQQLTGILGRCFDALKVYGKEPEQLDSLNRMFQFVLAEYPIEKITEAFRVYLSRSSDLPAPADIVAIIRRGNKPPFDKAVYVRLEKKGHDARTFAEDKYMKEYEDFQMNG